MQLCMKGENNNIRGWYRATAVCRRSLCQLLRIDGCRVVGAADPLDRNLGFLDRSRDFFFQGLLSCTHEAEWTPFQTRYFSENLVAPGIEPGLLDL
jgi:hypothetical protein